MRARALRLLSSAALALALASFGVPIDRAGPFVESAQAQTLLPLVSTVDSVRQTSTVRIALDPIGNQKRGRSDVFVRATTGQAGLICRLSIAYADGKSDSPDNATADANGVCIFHFDVPDRKGAVGKAKAKLKVTANQDSPLGSANQTFTVKSS